VDGDALSFRVEAVSSGTLTKGGVAVTPGVTLLGSGETWMWTPAINANGTLTAFTVKVYDGTTASASAVPVSVSVAAVNDAPTLNTIDDLIISQNAGLQTVNLSGISAGGGESQTLTVTASSGNANVIPHPTVTYASPGSTGSMSFTPVPNTNGTAIITVTVQDNGGTNNGGVDTIVRTFTVTVTGELRLNYEQLLTNGAPGLRIFVTAGLPYVLQASTDLSSWLPVFTNQTGAAGLDFIQAPITNPVQRFFRGKLF